MSSSSPVMPNLCSPYHLTAASTASPWRRSASVCVHSHSRSQASARVGMAKRVGEPITRGESVSGWRRATDPRAYLMSWTPTALLLVPDPTPAPTVPDAMRWTNLATMHDVEPFPVSQIAELLPEMYAA